MPIRHATLSTALAAATLALAACSPATTEAPATEAETVAPATGTTATAIEGLPTEKAQVSYVVGMNIGRTLEPIKDEIDLATVNRAIADVLAEKPLLVSEAQVSGIMEPFARRMQEKQAADAAALAAKNLAEGQAFLAGNAKKPGITTTASGLQYQAITEGSGPKPTAADTVVVHYVGTLLDGTKFDSSYDRGEPAQFVLNQVVPGWTEGLQLMPAGSKYRLWLPAALGYGEQGAGGTIGPNQTLVFEVELLEVKGATPAP